MKVETNRWHYSFYKLLSDITDKDAKKKINFCTYWRRVLLYTPFLILFLIIFGILFVVLAALITIAVNLVTIPFGFGVAVTWPEWKFLQVPFCVTVNGKKQSLAKFFVPLWLIVVASLGLWLGFSTDPEGMITAFKWTGIIGAAIIATIVLYFVCETAKEKLTHQHDDGPIAEGWRLTKLYLKAQKEKVCPMIEFVEPIESQSTESPQV